MAYPNLQRWPHFRVVPLYTSDPQMLDAIFSASYIHNYASPSPSRTPTFPFSSLDSFPSYLSERPQLAYRMRYAGWYTPLNHDFAKSTKRLFVRYGLRAARVLHCPAFTPHHSSMRILVPILGVECPLNVLASRSGPVTVLDVFAAIHQFLMLPVHPWMVQHLISLGVSKRVKASLPRMRQLDLLHGQTRFAGLSLKPYTEEWILHLKK